MPKIMKYQVIDHSQYRSGVIRSSYSTFVSAYKNFERIAKSCDAETFNSSCKGQASMVAIRKFANVAMRVVAEFKILKKPVETISKLSPSDVWLAFPTWKKREEFCAHVGKVYKADTFKLAALTWQHKDAYTVHLTCREDMIEDVTVHAIMTQNALLCDTSGEVQINYNGESHRVQRAVYMVARWELTGVKPAADIPVPSGHSHVSEKYLKTQCKSFDEPVEYILSFPSNVHHAKACDYMRARWGLNHDNVKWTMPEAKDGWNRLCITIEVRRVPEVLGYLCDQFGGNVMQSGKDTPNWFIGRSDEPKVVYSDYLDSCRYAFNALASKAYTEAMKPKPTVSKTYAEATGKVCASPKVGKRVDAVIREEMCKTAFGESTLPSTPMTFDEAIGALNHKLYLATQGRRIESGQLYDAMRTVLAYVSC